MPPPSRLGAIAAIRAGLCLAILACVPFLGGCNRDSHVKAVLEARTGSAAGETSVEIRAQVTGAQPDMAYKWFSTHGEFVAYESDPARIRFKFGPGSTADQVSLEIWQGQRRMARSQIEVRLPEEHQAALKIRVTKLPPHDPGGLNQGPHPIAGDVLGDVNPNCLVVVYCRDQKGIWTMQPNIYVKHFLGADRTWRTTTFGGPAYAVLLVEPTYTAPFSTGALPPLGGGVVARTVFDGTRN